MHFLFAHHSLDHPSGSGRFHPKLLGVQVHAFAPSKDALDVLNHDGYLLRQLYAIRSCGLGSLFHDFHLEDS